MSERVFVSSVFHDLQTKKGAKSLKSSMSDFLRRTLDITVALSGLILLSPLWLLVSVMIKHDSSGPILYRGPRMGRGGKPFSILKFRSMYTCDLSSNGPPVTAGDDPRITRAGRWLRTTKLNELPQLWNLLVGDMTLVGPRPEDPEIAAQWPVEVQRELLSVRPGITSLATVLYVDEEGMLKFADVTKTYLRSILPEKNRLDLLYVHNRSLLLDLDILLRTMLVLIPRLRSLRPRVEDILLGPIRLIRLHVAWFTIDAMIAFASVGLAGLLWRSVVPLDVGLGRCLVAALAMTAVFTVVNWLTGVQRVQWRYASATEAVDVVLSAASSTLLALTANARIQKPPLPSEMLLVSGVLAMVAFLGARFHKRILLGMGQRLSRMRDNALAGRERVLVVGAGEGGQLTTWLLRSGTMRGAFNVVGIVDDNLSKLGTLIHRVPVIGLCDRIPEIVQERAIGTIVFAIHTIPPLERNRILNLCWQTSARTVVVPDILTFMRRGLHPGDRRTWMPTGNDPMAPAGPECRLTEVELREQIRILAEMAKLGNFAGVAEQLMALEDDFARLEGVQAPGDPLPQYADRWQAGD